MTDRRGRSWREVVARSRGLARNGHESLFCSAHHEKEQQICLCKPRVAWRRRQWLSLIAGLYWIHLFLGTAFLVTVALFDAILQWPEAQLVEPKISFF
jgi:hypothetical protein